MTLSVKILFLFLSPLFAMSQPSKTYVAKKIDKDIEVIGDGSHELWKSANELTDFTYPWESGVAPATKFKALHNSKWLYCLFTVEDSNIHVFVESNEKREAVFSDRVEIFLRKDSSMNPYYGLELDANGRVYDYQAVLHRKFDNNWSWPKGHLVVKAKRSGNGYCVEVAISKESLSNLGLLTGNRLEAGLFRADCLELWKKGERFNVKWISWMKPDSPAPDFHIPSAFGVLELQ